MKQEKDAFSFALLRKAETKKKDPRFLVVLNVSRVVSLAVLICIPWLLHAQENVDAKGRPIQEKILPDPGTQFRIAEGHSPASLLKDRNLLFGSLGIEYSWLTNKSHKLRRAGKTGPAKALEDTLKGTETLILERVHRGGYVLTFDEIKKLWERATLGFGYWREIQDKPTFRHLVFSQHGISPSAYMRIPKSRGRHPEHQDLKSLFYTLSNEKNRGLWELPLKSSEPLNPNLYAGVKPSDTDLLPLLTNMRMEKIDKTTAVLNLYFGDFESGQTIANIGDADSWEPILEAYSYYFRPSLTLAEIYRYGGKPSEEDFSQLKDHLEYWLLDAAKLPDHEWKSKLIQDVLFNHLSVVDYRESSKAFMRDTVSPFIKALGKDDVASLLKNLLLKGYKSPLRNSLTGLDEIVKQTEGSRIYANAFTVLSFLNIVEDSFRERMSQELIRELHQGNAYVDNVTGFLGISYTRRLFLRMHALLDILEKDPVFLEAIIWDLDFEKTNENSSKHLFSHQSDFSEIVAARILSYVASLDLNDTQVRKKALLLTSFLDNSRVPEANRNSVFEIATDDEIEIAKQNAVQLSVKYR